MKIAIDARAYHWTGIGRYIRSLLERFREHEGPHQYIILAPEEEKNNIASRFDAPNFSFVPVESSYYSFKEQTRFLRQLNRIDADIFHFTHFNVPYLFRKPYVVTIHDITRFIFPGQRKQKLIHQIGYEMVFQNTVERARSIICVSEATRRELLQFPFHIQASSSVVYAGVDERFFAPVSDADRMKIRLLLGTDDPYLLYVGVWMSHKNLRRLIDAYAIVLKTHPSLKLVITGKQVPGYTELVRYVQDAHMESHVIFPGFVSHDLLPALYAGASCFTFPSLYEGFGLPLLEAAACGTPVVTSGVSSMPEVMRDAAVYVNPEYVPGIARGISCVLDDSVYAQTLIGKGRERARAFNWSVCAEQTLGVYEQASGR